MRYPMIRTWFRRVMGPFYAPSAAEAPHGWLKAEPFVADKDRGVGNVAPNQSPEDP